MNSKIVAIHQPNFLPWLGYFYKIYLSDYFVLLDDVQYSKNNFINRNKIKTPNGEQWVTIPVMHSGNFGQLIKDVKIDNPTKNLNKIIKTIEMNYAKSKYYNIYKNEFIQIFEGSRDSLYELNKKLIYWCLQQLEIKTKVITSSSINNVQGESTERLVSICRELNATTYLSGFGGSKYQDITVFRENNINIQVYNFHHPQYTQLWNAFIPNLSIIDLLFNCGPSSKTILIF